MTTSTSTSTSTFTEERVSRTVDEVAHRHPSVVAVARLGWVAKGIVYGVLGVLAVPIAIEGLEEDRARGGAGEASQLGAITEIADTSLGALALWIIAIGLALYVLWRLISILLPAEHTAKAWLTRGGYLVSAIIYSVLAWTAVSFARHDRVANRTQTEDAKVERFTRELMENSAGRWLVGALGVCLVAVGLYFVIKGLRAEFRDELEPGAVGPVSHETIVTLGRVGWVGRGIVMGLVGWFLTSAAVHFRPREAKGFDGSLREVTESTLGPPLVAFVALALILYGLFCVISAPRQRLTGAS
jgi:Domain of Unknown Function (DUF1206)